MASNDTFSDFDITHSGYQQFFNDIDDLAECDLLTIRRKDQIKTHFMPITTSKIKVSLSQEQIVNRFNGMKSGIVRSQSINIEKSEFSVRDQNRKLVHRNPLRPSLIPIKMKDLQIASQAKEKRNDTLVRRKFSIPSERRNVPQQELKLSSLPMAQSMDTAFDNNRRFTDIRNNLPDKFKCGICLNTLQDPRVLDCLHTFCLECLYSIENTNQLKALTNKVKVSTSCESNEIDINQFEMTNDSKESRRKLSNAAINPIRKIFSSAPKKRADERKDFVPKRRLSAVTEKNKVSLKCPICSYKTEILIGGISRIPRNFLLERQIQEELKKLESQRISDESCSLCYDSVQAIGHCVNCQDNLCEVCLEAHLRQRSTSKHSVITLDDLKKKQMELLKEQNASVAKTILKCFIHPMQDLKLYCINCDQVACHNCTILLHKGHKFEPIARATKREIKEFKDSFERNQKFHEYVNDSISKLGGSMPKINANADTVQREIVLFLKDYFEALEAHKETLLRQISKAKEMKHLSIMEQQEYLRKRAHESNVVNMFAENLIKNGNDAEILIFVGILQRRFEHCQKSKMSIDPKISEAFQFLREIRAPATQQQHNIPLYGIIATQVADPKYSTLDIEEPIILRINRRVDIKLISKDCDGRPLCHGGLDAKLSVELRYKDDPIKTILTEVSDKRDGSYVIAFTPDTAGLMSLSIKIDNKDIKGSPFLLCIRKLHPHSGIYHCCTFCSSKGSRTAICACESKMPGYKGCGHGHDGHPGKRHWSCCASVLESSECTATNSFRI